MVLGTPDFRKEHGERSLCNVDNIARILPVDALQRLAGHISRNVSETQLSVKGSSQLPAEFGNLGSKCPVVGKVILTSSGKKSPCVTMRVDVGILSYVIDIEKDGFVSRHLKMRSGQEFAGAHNFLSIDVSIRLANFVSRCFIPESVLSARGANISKNVSNRAANVLG